MTPPQSTGIAAPTDESVAGLVARASKALKTYGQGRGDKFCLDTHKAMKAMDLGLEALRAQEAALSTLAGELELMTKAHMIRALAHDMETGLRKAAEARATTAEAQVVAMREALGWFQDEPEWWDTPREFRDKIAALSDTHNARTAEDRSHD